MSVDALLTIRALPEPTIKILFNRLKEMLANLKYRVVNIKCLAMKEQSHAI